MPKKTEPKSATAIAPTLLLKGAYKGLAHRKIDRGMCYVIRLRVEHELDTESVKYVLRGPCRITYNVPASASNEKVGLDGAIDSAMPDNGDEIWLDDHEPRSVTFAIHHSATAVDARDVAALLELLRVTDRQLVASIVPLQKRLL